MELFLIVVLAVVVANLYSRISKLEQIHYTEKHPNNQSVFQSSIAIPTPTPLVAVKETPTERAELKPISATFIPVPVKPVKDLEFMTGTRWFTGVGVVLVLLGIGFFFRYAFTHNLISPVMRVLTGLVFGGIFISLGFWLKKKYTNYGLSLVGVGLGAMYIAFYAAYAFYSLVPALISFALMITIVGTGIVFAVRYSAEQLAATSLIAGYLGIILFVNHLSVVGTFFALSLMSIVIIAVSYYKQWPRVGSLALLFTTIAVAAWIPLRSETETLLMVVLLAGLYLVFVLSNLINFTKTEGQYSSWQAFNLYATPIIFFIAETGVLSEKKPIALVAFGIALLYAALTLLVRSMAPAHTALKKFIEVSRLIFPSFIALGIMLYFNGEVASLTLAVEGFIVVCSGLYFGNRLQYVTGQLILGISVILSMAFASEYRGVYPVVLNAPTLTFIGIGLALIFSWIAHVLITSELTQNLQKVFRVFDSLFAYVLFFSVITIEITRNVPTKDADQFSTVGVSLFALLMVTLALYCREKAVRYITYAVFCFLVAAVIIGTFDSVPAHALINSNVLAMSAVSLLGIFVYRLLSNPNISSGLESEFNAVRTILLIGVNLSIFTVLTMVVHWHFVLIGGSVGGVTGYAERLCTSLFWVIYASTGLVVGIVRRSIFSRQVATVLFVLATLKILLFDSLELNDLYRFASFILLGVVMLIAGFLYTKFRNRINSFVGITGPQVSEQVPEALQNITKS